jgi:hypothetical protein
MVGDLRVIARPFVAHEGVFGGIKLQRVVHL